MWEPLEAGLSPEPPSKLLGGGPVPGAHPEMCPSCSCVSAGGMSAPTQLTPRAQLQGKECVLSHLVMHHFGRSRGKSRLPHVWELETGSRMNIPATSFMSCILDSHVLGWHLFLYVHIMEGLFILHFPVAHVLLLMVAPRKLDSSYWNWSQVRVASGSRGLVASKPLSQNVLKIGRALGFGGFSFVFSSGLYTFKKFLYRLELLTELRISRLYLWKCHFLYSSRNTVPLRFQAMNKSLGSQVTQSVADNYVVTVMWSPNEQLA